MDLSSNIPTASSPLGSLPSPFCQCGLLPPCCPCWNVKGWKAGASVTLTLSRNFKCASLRAGRLPLPPPT